MKRLILSVAALAAFLTPLGTASPVAANAPTLVGETTCLNRGTGSTVTWVATYTPNTWGTGPASLEGSFLRYSPSLIRQGESATARESVEWGAATEHPTWVVFTYPDGSSTRVNATIPRPEDCPVPTTTTEAPPVTDPPVTDPPATDPPVTDPPATDPPVTDPPVTDPPATDPPESTDPPGPNIGVHAVCSTFQVSGLEVGQVVRVTINRTVVHDSAVSSTTLELSPPAELLNFGAGNSYRIVIDSIGYDSGVGHFALGTCAPTTTATPTTVAPATTYHTTPPPPPGTLPETGATDETGEILLIGAAALVIGTAIVHLARRRPAR